MNKISALAATIFIASSILTPAFALAANSGINISAIKPYSDSIIDVINSVLVPVLIAIAFIVFLWGVYKYFILGGADEKSRTEGRQFVLWGVIGFVIIFCVWALVNIVIGVFNLSGGSTAPRPPTF